VKEKPFTSSLNKCPEACCRIPSYYALFTSFSVDISLEDDVTVILLLDVPPFPHFLKRMKKRVAWN
jgi:hypothetical protein